MNLTSIEPRYSTYSEAYSEEKLRYSSESVNDTTPISTTYEKVVLGLAALRCFFLTCSFKKKGEAKANREAKATTAGSIKSFFTTLLTSLSWRKKDEERASITVLKKYTGENAIPNGKITFSSILDPPPLK